MCIACTKGETTTIGRSQPKGIEVMNDLGKDCNQQQGVANLSGPPQKNAILCNLRTLNINKHRFNNTCKDQKN